MSNQQPAGFRLAGIPIEVPVSGVLGIILLAYLWAPTFGGTGLTTSRWVLAGAFAVLLSFATLVHEFAHALTARAFGFPVHRVVLQLLGGVTYYERRTPSPMREGLIAASGPAATFMMAGVFYAVAAASPIGSVAWVLGRALMWANLVMGVYNAIPGLPLDGGTVLRCLIWGVTGSERKGLVWAARTGQLVAVATFALPFVMAAAWQYQPDIIFFVLAGLLAMMLWQGATSQLRAGVVREAVAGVTAASLARRAIPVDRDLPLAEAIRRAAAAGAGAFVVLGPDGQPAAIGQAAAIAAVPEARRPWVAAADVARSLESAAILPMALSGEDLLRAVSAGNRGEYLVIDPQGLVYGVLLASDLELALRARP